MRFNSSKILGNLGLYIFIGVVCAIVIIYVQKDLNLYIHPRYILFTLVMAVIGLAVAVFGFYGIEESEHSHDVISKGSALMCMVMVVAIFSLKPEPLSSRLASNRKSISTNNVQSQKISLARNTENIKLEDWASLLSQPFSAKLVIGKKAVFSGFVMPSSTDSERMFVSRFVVTCCAVDARPIQVEVQNPKSMDNVSRDEWVEVSGVFEDIDGAILLVANNVRKIERPQDPYAY